jgi:hypothetical protein
VCCGKGFGGEGPAFFDLGTLLAYRRGEFDPAKELAAVDSDIAELVMHMIQRAPGAEGGGGGGGEGACCAGVYNAGGGVFAGV